MKSTASYPHIIAVVVLLTATITISNAQPSFTAWVVNSLGETLSRVDLSSGQVQLNAGMLGSAPNDIIIKDNLAYIVNSLSNNVQLFDLEAEQTIGTIEIYQGLNPYFIALDEENTRAFVSNFLTGNASILDLQAGVESGVLTIGGAPEGICVAEGRLFITDVNYSSGSFGPGHLYAFSLETLDLLGDVTVGINPQVVKWGPDGNLHVVCTGNFDDIPGQVDIVDPETMTVQETIPLGGTPGSLTFTSPGIAFLGGANWNGTGTVYAYDGITHEIIRGAENPIAVPSSAMGIAAIPNDQLLVCCFNTDELVQLYDDGTIAAVYPVGDGPVAVAVEIPSTAVKPVKKQDEDFAVAHSFPEPFNAETVLIYTLQNSALTTFEIYDITGRLVEQLDLGRQRSGNHQLTVIPGPCWRSGVYWYRLQAGRQILTGSLVYVK